MKTTPIATILTLALLTAPALAGGVTASTDANEEQTGRTAWCSVSHEWRVFKTPPGSEIRRDHTPGTVDPVEPGTHFDLWIHDPAGTHDVVITFYSSDGQEIESIHNETVGGDRPTVPNGASWGKVCIRPDLPVILPGNPAFEWHYQDGFSS